MRMFSLLLILFSFNSIAGFEKVLVEKLDFEYYAPHGKGFVQKVGIGQSLMSDPYEIEILKTEDSFELTSSYVDFTWKNPISFFFEIESFISQDTSAGLGTKNHYVNSKELIFRPKGRGEYIAEDIKGECEGYTSGSFTDRLMEDCLLRTSLEIKKLVVPSDFILYKTLKEILNPRSLPSSVTVDQFVLKINQGNFKLNFIFKYFINLNISALGDIVFENNKSIIAIKLNKLRIGQIPITNLFLLKLKELIKNPDVSIDPPWIKIKIGKK